MSRCAVCLMLGLLAGAEPRRDRHGDPLPDGALARLGTIQQRVAASRLALSADGRTLVTVAAGRAITRWDASSGKMRDYRLLPGKPMREFWLSSDGRLLAVAEEKSLAVFDTESGACKHRLAVSAQRVAFRPGGKEVVTAEEDHVKQSCRIRVWDLATTKNRLLAEVPTWVSAFAFRPDGKRLFAAVTIDSLRCWDMDSGKQVWRNNHRATDLAVSRDGQTVATDGYKEQGCWHLWEADTGRRIGGSSVEIRSVWKPLAFAPDARTLFQGTSKDVLLWDVVTGKVRRRLVGAGSDFVVAPDGKTLISRRGALLRRWDVESGRPLYPDTSEHGHIAAVCGVVFTPDGKGLVTAGVDKTIRVWDRSTQQPRTLLTGVHPRYDMLTSWRTFNFPPQVLAVTADSRRLLSDAGDGQLRLTDIRTGKEVRRFNVRLRDREELVHAVRLSADGRNLWTLTYPSPTFRSSRKIESKGTMIEWDAVTGRTLSEHSLPWPGDLSDFEIAPDGQTVALPDGRVRDARSGKERLIQPNPSLSYRFAFSADSRLVAAMANREGNAAAVYEVLTGRPLVRVEAAVNWYSSLALSPDGRLLIVAGRDALHVWEVRTGRRLLHLPATGRLPAWTPGLFASCLAVAPDGRSAATGHDDGTVLLWDLAPAWKRLAERSVPPLTPAQLDACWADLLKDDPGTAYPAMDRLSAAPALTLPLLRKHVRPVTIDPQWLQRRLADLDASEFAVREKASHDLERVAEAIQPRLQRELEQTSSLEVRRRLRRLLEAPRTATLPPEVVRRLRAVAVLEWIATPEARTLLSELAKGEEGDPLTRAARAALIRLTATHAP
jgi:WD40 repeat protein